MPNHERLFEMNAVIYYSNTLESYKIANYISQKTNYPLIDFHKLNHYSFDNIFIVFPVHYQNIPQSIKPIFKRIHASKAVIIATYGKMSFGNVLSETQKLLNTMIVGGGYIPTKHPYVEDDKSFDDYKVIDQLIDKINSPNETIFPKEHKSVFANFFPLTRHRIGVRIKVNNKCTKCGVCNTYCQFIDNGVINNKKCIRCLKCVNNCPQHALEYKLSSTLRHYLRKPRCSDIKLF